MIRGEHDILAQPARDDAEVALTPASADSEGTPTGDQPEAKLQNHLVVVEQVVEGMPDDHPGPPETGLQQPDEEASSPPVDAAPEEEMRQAARQIRARTANCLVDNGRDLLTWRDRLPTGQFHRWIVKECGLTVRTAQLAMMVAEYTALHDGRKNFSRLSPSIQYLLAAPSTPEDVREQVLASFSDGRRFKVNEVKASFGQRRANRLDGSPIQRAQRKPDLRTRMPRLRSGTASAIPRPRTTPHLMIGRTCERPAGHGRASRA